MASLSQRLAACGLTMHPAKTRIVYCRDHRRRESHANVKFTFLGYEFRPRPVKGLRGDKVVCGYTPAVSPAALKSMRATIKALRIPRQTRRRWLR